MIKHKILYQQLFQMKKFSYNQCDKVNRKMNNLDELMNKFYTQKQARSRQNQLFYQRHHQQGQYKQQNKYQQQKQHQRQIIRQYVQNVSTIKKQNYSFSRNQSLKQNLKPFYQTNYYIPSQSRQIKRVNTNQSASAKKTKDDYLYRYENSRVQFIRPLQESNIHTINHNMHKTDNNIYKKHNNMHTINDNTNKTNNNMQMMNQNIHKIDHIEQNKFSLNDFRQKYQTNYQTLQRQLQQNHQYNKTNEILIKQTNQQYVMNQKKYKQKKSPHLQQLKQKMETTHIHGAERINHDKYNQKQQSINELNDQINSIMVKYKYQFNKAQENSINTNNKSLSCSKVDRKRKSQQFGRLINKKPPVQRLVTFEDKQKQPLHNKQPNYYHQSDYHKQLNHKQQSIHTKWPKHNKQPTNHKQIEQNYKTYQKRTQNLKRQLMNLKKFQQNKNNYQNFSSITSNQLNKNNKFESQKQSLVQQIIKVHNNKQNEINIFDRIQLGNKRQNRQQNHKQTHQQNSKQTHQQNIKQNNQKCDQQNSILLQKDNLSKQQSIIFNNVRQKTISQSILHNSKDIIFSKTSTISNMNIVDKSIDQLNEKIKKAQQKKKQLNIQFKPFKIDTVKKQNLKMQIEQRPLSQIKSQNSIQNCKNILTQQNINMKDKHKFIQTNQQQNQSIYQQSRYSSIAEVPRKMIRKNKVYEVKLKNNENQNNQFIQKVVVDQQKQSKKSQTKSAIISQIKSTPMPQVYNFTQNSNQKKLNKSIIALKKPHHTKNQVQLLVINLTKQIELDKKFRTLKIWFQFSNDPNKWSNLEKTFKTYKTQDNLNQYIDNQIIKKIFSTTLNQHDPFYGMGNQTSINQKHHFCIESLVEAYFKAQQYWNNHILRQFQAVNLTKNGFSNRCIDLEHKSHVLISDLVRFVNMYINSMYRNRDFVLIFQRIQQNSKLSSNLDIEENKLEFQSIIRTLCN